MTTYRAIFFTMLATIPLAGQPAVVHTFERTVQGAELGLLAQAGTPGEGLRQMAVQFIGSEAGIPGKVVKGAPYSALAVTETTQTLADGNRIRHKSTAQMYRDSEGRTRREASLGAIGLAPEAELPQIVFITDPVAGFNYVLNMKERTATKTKMAEPGAQLAQLRAHLEHGPGLGPDHGAEHEVQVKVAEGGGGNRVQVQTFAYRATAPAALAGKPESLGRQTVEGVQADGTRTVITIEAGKMGNERPIEMVSERWYSPELDTLVSSRHNDPRMGETVYRLTNISRSEPSPTLFEVPVDFKITETRPDVIRMRMPAPDGPK
jgi:hypothetical protein